MQQDEIFTKEKIRDRMSHMYSPKIYWTIVVCLIGSLPVILLLSRLGYANSAAWITCFAGMFLLTFYIMASNNL